MSEILAAWVDEANCIGCGKCRRVCPTDAIVGAKHFLHTIIPMLCTACEKCVDACPTNCINLKTPFEKMTAEEENQLVLKKQRRLSDRVVHATVASIETSVTVQDEALLRKQTVADAIARVKARKNKI